jgi:hypothetical protein
MLQAYKGLTLNEKRYELRWNPVTSDFTLLSYLKQDEPAGTSVSSFILPLEAAREVALALQERIDFLDFCPKDEEGVKK